MKNIVRVALPTGVTAVVLLMVVSVAARVLGIDRGYVGTMSALVWIGVALIHLFWVAKPYTKWSLGICLLCLVGVTLSVVLARSVFGLERGLGWTEWGVILVCNVVAVPMIWAGRKVMWRVTKGEEKDGQV